MKARQLSTAVLVALTMALVAATASPQGADAEEAWKIFQASLQLETAKRPAYAFTHTVKRKRRAPAGQRFEDLDTIRVDVAVAEGARRYSWPGAAEYDSYSLPEILGDAITEAGNLVLVVHSLIVSGEGKFAFAADEPIDGRPARRYDYTRAAEESNFSMLVDGNPIPVGHAGSAWIDRQSNRLLRIESRAAGMPQEIGVTSMEEWISYSDVRLGDSDYTLPLAGVLVLTDRTGAGQRNELRNEAYRIFTDPGRTADGSGAEGVAEASSLPEGLQVRIKLEEEIRFEQQAVGDPVTAIVVGDAKKDKTTWVTKGTVVRGRIKTLQRNEKPKIHYVLGFDWTTVEAAGKPVDIRAEVLRGGPFHGLIESERHWEIAREYSGGKEGRMQFKPGLLYWDTVQLYIRKGLPMTIGILSPTEPYQ